MPITWIRNRTYFLSYLISFSSVFSVPLNNYIIPYFRKMSIGF
nr:MAG TPA: hypothetical protein [Caudoviricetes sp.]